MELVYKRSDNKAGINSKNSFVVTLPESLSELSKFDDVIDSICNNVTLYAEKKGFTVGSQNFRNTRGRWFEWLLNYLVWQFFKSINSPLRMINLPNADKFECTNLYKQQYSNQIQDLKDKLKLENDIELITSNPDFVLIDTSKLDLNVDLNRDFDIKVPSVEDLEFFDNLYLNFKGKCDLENLIGYVSVKTSTRSDRRFQWLHEGNLAKSLHLHIRTREWRRDLKPLKFYCMSFALNPQDIIALKTATTHTIASIGLTPERSVDHAFIVNDQDSLQQSLEQIINDFIDH